MTVFRWRSNEAVALTCGWLHARLFHLG